MSYLSFSFALFLFSFAVLFYLVPLSFRPWILLLANMLFYLSFGSAHFLFLLFVAVSTFITAKIISGTKYRKLPFLVCILINAALWFSLKQLPWLIGLGNFFFQTQLATPEILLFVPIGISYYTLQAVSYLTDVYRRKIDCEHHFGKYLLFLSYFPAIVQGPISRYNQLSPQLSCRTKFDFEQILCNVTLILFGLVKKIVIADRLHIFTDQCFSSFQRLSGLILYLGAVCFAIELYADFSGCVDICRGVSGIFGIDLPQNFFSPYLSGSIQEFWKRWHISLSSWLRDYVYIPLGGNRKGKLRKDLNLILTFLISGIWHGAGVTYGIWALLQAIYQIFGAHTASARAKLKQWLHIQPDSFSDKLFKVAITFHLTVFSWIFFRSESVAFAFQYISNMFSGINLWILFSQDLFSLGLNFFYFNLVFFHVVLLTGVDYLQLRHVNIIQVLRHQHIVIRWIVYFLLIFDLMLFGAYGRGYSVSAFLYGGF